MFRSLHTFCYRLSDFFYRARPHIYWLIALVLTVFSLTFLNMSASDVKRVSDWSWIDIFGEGATALFLGVWLCIVLASRPKGRTTNWLAFGLLGVFASCYQDVLDEFFKLHEGHYWDSLLESLPIGLLALTFGMFRWYQEQKEVQKYLHKRARIFHSMPHRLHGETSLPQTPHLKKALVSENKQLLVFLDVVPDIASEESTLARSEYGKLRSIIADTILWNLPDESRVFHIVGDQYAVLLVLDSPSQPTLDDERQNEIVQGLIGALRSVRYFPASAHSAIDMTVMHSTQRVSENMSEVEAVQVIKRAQFALIESIPLNNGSTNIIQVR
ncbi:hypothetical protein [Marinomonas balearica]|uniref:GGDEF domain-containing protein n=1 Tax=Marinomonas balearica TaxID=491947 RepID=A0A4V3CHK4_9GAMM|nr:hypothetical protein [Marinomonas balearica]TDP01913.1 hypothetical protein DFP79_0090 [Marinomonas balearica]